MSRIKVDLPPPHPDKEFNAVMNDGCPLCLSEPVNYYVDYYDNPHYPIKTINYKCGAQYINTAENGGLRQGKSYCSNPNLESIIKALTEREKIDDIIRQLNKMYLDKKSAANKNKPNNNQYDNLEI